jgi:hypothetical protein
VPDEPGASEIDGRNRCVELCTGCSAIAPKCRSATLGSTVVRVSAVVVGVRFPHEGEARADDEEWLQELAGSCGAEWPDVMSASAPGQIGLRFATVAAADRFVLGVEREGRFSIVRRTDL